MADDLTSKEATEYQGSLPFDQDARYKVEGEENEKNKEEDERDAGAREASPRSSARGTFKYDGRGLSKDEFTQHVSTYNFGSILPDFIVLHNTAIPKTVFTAADFPTGWVWDSGEEGLSASQIKQKRKRLLDNIRDDYANNLGWETGPHLFIDDRFIWLFTPMFDYGTHAKWGNKITRNGNIHYSIGIEVVGYYTRRQWPPQVRELVRHAVTTLQQRLRTFELKYMYPNGSPGMVGTGDNQRPAHPEKLTWGGISSHRDYNKPECPGDAITADFYMKVLRGEV